MSMRLIHNIFYMILSFKLQINMHLTLHVKGLLPNYIGNYLYNGGGGRKVHNELMYHASQV